MIAAAALLVTLVSPSPKPTLDIDRAAIRHVVTQRHEGAHVDAIVIQGDYALAMGRSANSSLHDGLHLAHSGWRIMCSFTRTPSSTDLSSHCDFPAGIANELAMNEAVQAAAESGNISVALSEEKRAFASATGPERDTDRARVQFLTMLSERMRTGLTTRQDAIRQWSEFRFSWSLP